MNRFEAVADAFAHRNPQSLPYHIEMTRDIKSKLCATVGIPEESFGDWIGNYCDKIDIGDGGIDGPGGIHTDDFGVAWDRSGQDKDIGTIVAPVLPHAALGAYKFPLPDITKARNLVGGAVQRNGDRALFAKIGMTLFERAWSLCGFENFLMHLVSEEDFVAEILRKVCDHRLALVASVLELPIVGFYFGDDYGQQGGTLFGLPTFRTLIKPELARLFAPIKAAGKLVVLHSCGNIEAFLDDLVEIGLDCYQTVQPEVYDFKSIKKRYGGSLTFWGGISTQTTLPSGTTQDVREAVRRAATELGSGGGYIAGPTHRITPDTPIENVLALVDELKSIKT
jgi:uroporphyrinogen decarboxylase